MHLPSSYVLDKDTIRLKAYQLICYFYANKEIARITDPGERDHPIAKLEDKFFYREISKLLLEIAISIRVLDDQIKALPPSTDMRIDYEQSMNRVNTYYKCMMFDDKVTLRGACNKIIHAQLVEPHIQEVKDGRHERDMYEWLGWSDAMDDGAEKIEPPTPIVWERLSDVVRLGGKQNGKQWWQLLQVPIFVRAISELYE